MLTWNSGGVAQATLHQLASKWQAHMEISFMIMLFMKLNYNWLLDMLGNDNIMTVKASEVVQKVPADEKNCYKCSLCVIVSIQPQHI